MSLVNTRGRQTINSTIYIEKYGVVIGIEGGDHLRAVMKVDGESVVGACSVCDGSVVIILDEKVLDVVQCHCHAVLFFASSASKHSRWVGGCQTGEFSGESPSFLFQEFCWHAVIHENRSGA